MSNTLRIAINGYGRIGRCVLRALYERNLQQRIQIVAINEPSDLDSMAYLTEFDSTHGAFTHTVAVAEDQLIIDDKAIQVFHETEPDAIAWDELNIDLLLECSGHFSERHQLQRFIDAGCPRLLLSHPGVSAEAVDNTIVAGINQDSLTKDQVLVSAASCTTNAIVPVLHLLHQQFGIEHAFLTTLHSVMNDQPLIDGYHHRDLRRTRSAMQSMVPVSTGLATGVERLLPELQGRVQAKAIRVPIVNVSAINLCVNFSQLVKQGDLLDFLDQAVREMPNLISYTRQHHASIDFNHNPHSAIIDSTQITTNDRGFANMLVWFDNEWGFAHRMLDVACAWAQRFNHH